MSAEYDLQNRTDSPIYKSDESKAFESLVLSECLDYAKEFKDYEPLETAIDNNNLILETAISDIQYLIDVSRQTSNTFMANKLIAIRNKLTIK